MTRIGLFLASALVVGTLAGWLGTVSGQPDVPTRAAPEGAGSPETGIAAATSDYVKAFNAADAKAAAGLWTDDGKYIDSEGGEIAGRTAIETDLTTFFKANPGVTIEVKVESVTPVRRGLATAEGLVLTTRPGDPVPTETRYTAVHVLDDGQWRAASVREWVPDPVFDVTTKNLEWLVGEWKADGETGREVRITYAWDEDKVFITGKYKVTDDGKVVSKGTQVLGRNPTGGLRSWMFDSTGTTSDGIWVRDGSRWINEAVGVLPDGTEIISVNVLVPLGPDAFTWQTVERTVDGEPMSDLPPVKVTRVSK